MLRQTSNLLAMFLGWLIEWKLIWKVLLRCLFPPLFIEIKDRGYKNLASRNILSLKSLKMRNIEWSQWHVSWSPSTVPKYWGWELLFYPNVEDIGPDKFNLKNPTCCPSLHLGQELEDNMIKATTWLHDPSVGALPEPSWGIFKATLIWFS